MPPDLEKKTFTKNDISDRAVPRSILRTFQACKMELFVKIMPLPNFLQKAPSWTFHRVLNKPLKTAGLFKYV